jgi:hypothetical protein
MKVREIYKIIIVTEGGKNGRIIELESKHHNVCATGGLNLDELKALIHHLNEELKRRALP